MSCEDFVLINSLVKFAEYSIAYLHAETIDIIASTVNASDLKRKHDNSDRFNIVR